MNLFVLEVQTMTSDQDRFMHLAFAWLGYVVFVHRRRKRAGDLRLTLPVCMRQTEQPKKSHTRTVYTRYEYRPFGCYAVRHNQIIKSHP